METTTARSNRRWRLPDEVIAQVLTTLETKRAVEIQVPNGRSPFRYQQALNRRFASHYPDLRLTTRTLPGRRLLCWLSRRNVA